MAAEEGGDGGDGHDVAFEDVAEGDGEVDGCEVVDLDCFEVVVVGVVVPFLRDDDACVVDQDVDACGLAADQSDNIIHAIDTA